MKKGLNHPTGSDNRPKLMRSRGPSRARILLLVLLALTASGCIESLTGRTKFHVAVENYSGADIPVRMTLTENKKTTEFDFEIVKNGSFAIRNTTLPAGDYVARVSAGGVETERSWALDPGKDGIILRIHPNLTAEFIRVK